MNSYSNLKVDWNVLCWNVRGLNDKDKRLAVYNKIDESNCAIICLQETKCENFEHSFIRTFCPKRFDRFVFVPSIGASGGIIVLWNSKVFMGTLIETTHSAIRMQFASAHTAEIWTMITVYGPCRGVMRDEFVQWLFDLDIPVHDNWLLLGDFNFMRSVDNRNKPGADMADIFLFNNIISHLGLLELPLKGRRFTWSNMQATPLLEQIDWFFTSCEWTLRFPNTMVFPLAKSTSDHTPCVVSISTSIPKAKIFRFENIWLEQPGFMEVVTNA
jgi:exonuclease III